MTFYYIIIGTFFVVVPPDIDETYLYQVESQSKVTESGNSEVHTWHIIHPHSPHFGRLACAL
jgi:hypothetical protein